MTNKLTRPIRKIILGERFGGLVCTKEVVGREGVVILSEFLCDCGNTVVKRKPNVTSGHTKSCGCLWEQTIIKAVTTKDDASKRPLWNTYKNMLHRCNNEKDKQYKYYGGRGISVCESWANDFYEFEAYMGIRPDGHTLDRIDNDGNYEPGNVRWATPKQQANNTRQNIRFEIDGKTYSKQMLATKLGITEAALDWRRRNWGSYEKAA